ncbi:hypothetical protein Micbo1qcDRAFT_221969 [Microdochium bolleyi]|uniref:Uncharacterized protein n=1 Tax=Microdochium bolleyi TaxID=196109 RepID=A0A136IKQ5_9PEZI|nr:hypothetical protein Micbo1qcDRAFT_221969 [Microdochium bolleyi]
MTDKTPALFVVGSGPGIGRAVAKLFSFRRYAKVALFARNTEQLKADQEAVSFENEVQVRTYPVDVTDTAALLDALDQAEKDLASKPQCLFYNAARVQPSPLLEHDVKEIEYDFKINVSALYIVAQRYIPHLLTLASQDPSGRPALIVTSSDLPKEPNPGVFALSLVKAAQRNLMQSLAMTYGGKGVHLGVINVGGPVSRDHEVWNPDNIADKTWDWCEAARGRASFEVDI